MIFDSAFGKLHDLGDLIMFKPFIPAQVEYSLFLIRQRLKRFFDQTAKVIEIELVFNVIIRELYLRLQYADQAGFPGKLAQKINGLIPRDGKNIGLRNIHGGQRTAMFPDLYKNVLYDLFRGAFGFTQFKNVYGETVKVNVIQGSECIFIAF